MRTTRAALRGARGAGQSEAAPLLCALSDVPDSYSIPTTWSEAQSSCSIGSLRAGALPGESEAPLPGR